MSAQANCAVVRVGNMSDARLLVGDNLRSLRRLAAEGVQVDSVVTDPPYGLTSEKRSYRRASPRASSRAKAAGFMGCEWDAAVPTVEFWRAVYAVLKPGGYVLSFGGTRTYHRMACALEDAGFELRDMLSWLYGSGFPKSKNIGDGFGTALKPACEPIALARKPLGGRTVAANVLAFRTGALNIDGCRIEAEKQTGWSGGAAGGQTWNDSNCGLSKKGAARPDSGRWPANVLLDEDAAALLDAQSGTLKSGPNPRRRNGDNSRNVFDSFAGGECVPARGADAGGASRFFYCAKASARERAGSTHPTVKPIALMRYLCRLVTPPGGLVLDPFAGSGTTGEAAKLEGFSVVLMEREKTYAGDIRRRLKAAA